MTELQGNEMQKVANIVKESSDLLTRIANADGMRYAYETDKSREQKITDDDLAKILKSGIKQETKLVEELLERAVSIIHKVNEEL